MQPSSSSRRLLEEATARYSQNVGDAAAYLTQRGVSPDSWTSFRLGVVPADSPAPGHELYTGRLSIPYLTRAGIAAIKFRCIKDHDCKEANCTKYLGLDGVGLRLFNPAAFFARSAFIVLVEGEVDTITLDGEMGIPTVGFPGVKAWDAHPYWARCFAGYGGVYVIADGDDVGRAAAKDIAKTVDGKPVYLPDGQDTNSLYVTEGADALRRRLGL